MKWGVRNKLKNCKFYGDYVGHDSIINITMSKDTERGFVITHNVNIKPVSYFTGRETELQELRQRIAEGRKSVLVSGMGGIGKTHICRKLFEEYLNECINNENKSFRYIGYIEYNGDMGSSLQHCLKFKEQDSPEQNQEAAWRELEYLASDGKLLLFVDNVNNPISADQGIQRLKAISGVMILTSRQASLGDEFEPYHIGFLDTKQCIEIFGKIRFGNIESKINSEEFADLKYIIEILAGRHTITIELLAHLARTKLWSVSKLKEELMKKGFRLEFHKNGELVNIQKSYEKLYDLSELTEAEKNIMEAFSVFPYIPLAAKICNEWLLSDAKVNEDDDILMTLYQKGWLQFDIYQEKYALHPVFAQFIFDMCRPKANNHTGLIEGCKTKLKLSESRRAVECQWFIPFAETMIKKFGIERSMEYGELTEFLSYLLHYMAEYDKAEKWGKIIVDKYENIYGENHAITATSYCNLATAYEKLGNLVKAEELYRKSLYIRKQLLGEDNPDTADSYNNLAGVYKEQGRHEQAAELYGKSIRIWEQAYGENHFMVARGFNNLGSVYHRQKKYAEAEALYEKSISILIKVHGESYIDAGIVNGNLAVLNDELKKYEKAAEFFKKSITLSEKNYGENHLNTAGFYEDLAITYGHQKKYKKAEELFLKSISIYKEFFGEEHQRILKSYSNLAQLYKEQEDFLQAEILYEKCIKIQERINGRMHLDTIQYYDNLAIIHINKGEYEMAEELFKESIRIQEKLSGDKHPDIAIRYDNLAYACELQKKYTEAEKLYKKGIKVLKKAEGNNLLQIGRIYGNLAAMYNQKGEYQQVLSYDLEVYNIYCCEFGLNHSKTKNIYDMLRGIYFKCNPNGDFEQWLREHVTENP